LWHHIDDFLSMYKTSSKTPSRTLASDAHEPLDALDKVLDSVLDEVCCGIES